MTKSRSVPVIAILLGAQAAARIESIGLVRQLHPESPFILLTTPQIADALGPQSYTIWRDGGGRGPGGFLALLRRLAWINAAQVYDLAPCLLTRFMRILVRPRPKWGIWPPSDGKSGLS